MNLEKLMMGAALSGAFFIIGFGLGIRSTRNDAIQHNVAHYDVDRLTGELIFTWDKVGNK